MSSTCMSSGCGEHATRSIVRLNSCAIDERILRTVSVNFAASGVKHRNNGLRGGRDGKYGRR